MKVVIAGASGFIGRHFTKLLLENNCQVVALTRSSIEAAKSAPEHLRWVQWDGAHAGEWVSELDGCDALVNLAGENIGAKLWNEEFKRRILASRVESSNALAEAVRQLDNPPKLWLQGSAIGIYGSRGSQELNEDATPGMGFMAEVVKQWEAAVEDIAGLTRLVILRTGVVLGRGEGALEKMALPYRFFVGGVPGSGEQWLSWIHIQDQVQAMWHLLKSKDAQGIFNLTAPHPVQMRTMSEELARALSRPNWLPVPSFMLRMVLGEFARETILASQRVLPRRLREVGFEFEFSRLPEALADIYGREKQNAEKENG